MRHTLRMHGVTIGWSELEHRDPLTGRAWGTFRPGTGWELVEPVFELFVKAVPLKGGEPMDQDTLERYHAARDRLGLELVDPRGAVVPASAIHVAAYPGAFELEALLSG